MRTHQVEQDRQQAQALAIDDDAQLKVEPVALGGFIDGGVPVVDGAQVEAEILVDLQFPAQLAQVRQFVEGEVQPGAVVDHLVQFAGAFRQGLALPGGNLEAEPAQVFATGLFRFGLALDAQALVLLAQDDIGVFLAADVFTQVVEGQRRTVLDIALHASVAGFEGAELDTRQPQSWYRSDVVEPLLGRRWRSRVEHRLELFEQRGVLLGGRVGEGFLDFQQYRSGVFAVVADRAGASGIDDQQGALG